MQSPISSPTALAESPVAGPEKRNLLGAVGRKAQLLLILCVAVGLAAAVDQFLAHWLRIPITGAFYRRIGPEKGPQVFLAGSSLLQSGISWSDIAETLGQGVEVWTVAGSSPLEWEASQTLATNSNLTIVGVSAYDLNEYHLCDSTPDIVPVTRAIKDLWDSRSSWQFSKRLLSQYPLAYIRKLFPTAGKSDAVLVGLRRRAREIFRLSSAADDRAIVAVTPTQPVLSFGEDNQKVSEWPQSKTLRRVALMRSHFQGVHAFDGPKKRALFRIMQRAQGTGKVIVVVQPVAPTYAREFMTPQVRRNFEKVVAEAQSTFSQAQFVRLDKVGALDSDDYYSDLVHRNSGGRRISTEVFLKELKQHLAAK